MPEESLTLRLSSAQEGISAEALIVVFQDTIVALQEINKAVSEFGSVNLNWKIVGAGMSSPLTHTFTPFSTDKDNGHYGPQVIGTLMSGIQGLAEQSSPPTGFSELALKRTAHLLSVKAKGISVIEFATEIRRAQITKDVAKNANEAAGKLELDRNKKAGKYFEYGTLEGHLKTVDSQSGQDSITIVDPLTGKKTRCNIRGQELEDKVRAYWKHRVAVFGRITVDRLSGDPEEVKVEEIYELPGRDQLPQIEDLDGIDITGGVESSEYVRGLRDGD